MTTQVTQNLINPMVIKIGVLRNYVHKSGGLNVMGVEGASKEAGAHCTVQLYKEAPHQWFILRPANGHRTVSLQSLSSGRVLEHHPSYVFAQGDKPAARADFNITPDTTYFLAGNNRDDEPTTSVRAADSWIAGEAAGPAWIQSAKIMFEGDTAEIPRYCFKVERVLPTQVGKLTKSAVDDLLRAADKAQKGDVDAANATLEGMAHAVDQLQVVAKIFKSLTDLEHDPIRRRLEETVEAVGRNHERAAKIKQAIDEAVAKMQGIEKHQGELQPKIDAARQELATTQRDLAEHLRSLHATAQSIERAEHELKEAAKWSWVPVYGQVRAAKALYATIAASYRSIKTLVDNDIVETKNLKNDLGDYHTKLGRYNHEAEEVAKSEQALRVTLSEYRKEQRSLEAVRVELAGHDRALRHRLTFLSDVSLFWGKVSVLLKSSVEERLRKVQVMSGLLKQRMNGPSGQKVYAALKNALIEFGQHVDGDPADPSKPGVEDVAWDSLGAR